MAISKKCLKKYEGIPLNSKLNQNFKLKYPAATVWIVH